MIKTVGGGGARVRPFPPLCAFSAHNQCCIIMGWSSLSRPFPRVPRRGPLITRNYPLRAHIKGSHHYTFYLITTTAAAAAGGCGLQSSIAADARHLSLGDKSLFFLLLLIRPNNLCLLLLLWTTNFGRQIVLH